VKLPPFYTDHPGSRSAEDGAGLLMTVNGQVRGDSLASDFVNNIVLPALYLFAPMVYAAEVLTAVSLILGILVRFWGLIGALQILNLWLGLYNAEGNGPGPIFFLLVIQLIFCPPPLCRSLGLTR